MTDQRALHLACRLAVLYLLFWIISDVISLPREVSTLHYELTVTAPQTAARSPAATHFLQDAVLVLASNILRLALWSWLAIWFYQGGPRLHRFLGMIEPADRA